MESLTSQSATLVQKMGILDNWFMSRKGAENGSITVRQAGEIILEKALASDIDTSIKIVITQLRLDKDISTSIPLIKEDFEQIFLLPLTKGSFMQMLTEVEMMAGNKDLPLSLKFANY